MTRCYVVVLLQKKVYSDTIMITRYNIVYIYESTQLQRYFGKNSGINFLMCLF